MSSDSDEDELLQMALQEQSAGKKPSEPPPKPKPNSRSGGRRAGSMDATPNRKVQQKHRKGVDEEEDDSDLEILSISSGDEDHASSKKESKGASKRRAPKAGKDDDEHWQGGEPDCWKRVDEDELRRHVRDMREARAIPATQIKAEEEKMALAKKALQSLQSFPRGMECIDPLRLGIVDNRTLRMISEHSSSSPTIGELDPKTRERLNYFSEKFDSKLFISRIHQDTGAADLEGGSVSLKTDLKGRMQQKKQLVKENFDCFVSCKTTIDDIESKLRRIEEDPEGSGTKHLYDCMQGVNSIANRAFESLFERQAQAEKIRSVQGTIQRFRTLFNLPSAIRESISKGEYDLAVREYRKANSIVLPSHVGILKRVVGEVEKVMQEFKGMLYKSLEDPNIDLTNLENIVRLLLELEPESDPVWHYLNIQNHRIRGLLEKCSLDHEARMENLQNEMRAKASYDAKWRQIQQDMNHSSDIDSELLVMTGEQGDAFRGKYIRRLTAVVIHHVPAFWKVSVSVFSGKFAKASQVSADSNVNASAKRTEEKVGDGKYCSHSLDEVAGMLQSTLSAYGSEVQNTFRDLEESNILCPYMSDAIKEISKACRAFEAKESAPPVAVTALRTLQSEVTKINILRLCSWMRTTTEKITKDETWIPVSILERNRSPYTISSLPLAFRSIITFAMDQINTMIQSLRNEAMKLEDIFLLLQEIQESVRLAFLNCLLNFAGQLGHTGNQLLNEYDRESSHFQNGHAEPEDKSLDPLPVSIVNPHRQLLMVVSNIGFFKDELAHELYSKYRRTWQQSRGKDEEDADMQDLIASFSGLEENVLEQYTLAKRNLFRTAAVNYLLESGVQWGAAPAVKGVRDAAVDLLHTLVAVHAEVFAGCKPLLDKTLGILVEGLIDTFLSLFHENQETDFTVLDVNGFCQLMLELDYFETILNTYFTHEARESLKTLQGVLLEKATESVPETVETPSHSRRQTRGNDDALQDERQQGGTISPDDLIALAQQYSSELLQSELERTRINTACFVESISLDSVPDSAKAAYASFRGSMDSPGRGSQSVGPPSYSKQRRR
ncbi:exocyst complex component SEC5A-like isoform X1 [Solanum stenotomum]|uniref:exocyst complex component SEC5A-like isoform X1 n=1 Tax=Solanum stenotomum TaxID=172797 RepID=UPI0020D07AB1|nr:exocyst complex component SEC5A-like isoform X1 [Solanum stenotomum]XP_049399282.1 exocyst complex component SEC5A-like isoform X1 [Solanum stenotomum]